jgi:hypothetical protein
MSPGGQQLNRHDHWQCPLPPGIPLPRHQLDAYSELITGVLLGPDEGFARLAQTIRDEVSIPGATGNDHLPGATARRHQPFLMTQP